MKKNKRRNQGFTLIEMLVVMLVIAVLVLLFVPNLAKQRERIVTRGNHAFEKVMDTQVDLYKLNEGEGATFSLADMVKHKYITTEQKDKAEKMKYEIK